MSQPKPNYSDGIEFPKQTRADPARPALRYPGGKWRIAPWIIANMPPHRIYVEPYGGAGSVLLRKPRSYAEVYNDLDDNIVSYFRILRDPSSARRLIDALRNTPYARHEFELAYEPTDDPIERARRLVVRSFMGFGSDATNINFSTGFRANANRARTIPAHDWRNLPKSLERISDRLGGVVIENKPALDVLRSNNYMDALHYLDPPYLHTTRSRTGNSEAASHTYRHEMNEGDHIELADELYRLKGMIMISGYESDLYGDIFGDWMMVEKETMADGAKQRKEIIWFNAAAAKAIGGVGGPLFGKGD